MEKPICTFGSIRQVRFAFCVCFLLWFLAYIICSDDYATIFPHETGLNLFPFYAETKPIPNNPCSSRYIYIHNIPQRFNSEILADCHNLQESTDSDLCRAMLNMGLGPYIMKSHGNGAFFESKKWFATHPHLLEVIFHNRMKQYSCLTNDSSLASAIYVPFYAGLDLGRHLWGFNASRRDSGPIDLFEWLVEEPEWERKKGRDHFLVAGRATWDFRSLTNMDPNWGNKLMYLPKAKNVTILSLESSHWIKKDFAIPYPTNFHPSNDNQVIAWQNKMRKRKRKYLFSFVGSPRPKERDSTLSEIISQCQGAGENCKWLDCKSSSSENCDNLSKVGKMFRSSKFCLQPPGGGTLNRRSTFDSILAGCIPVFFDIHSAYAQYSWHLPKEYAKYSVFIPESKVKHGKADIAKTLGAMPEEEVVKMREEVIRLLPNIVYANPSSSSKLETFEDAVDLAIKGVLRRVEKLVEEMKAK